MKFLFTFLISVFCFQLWAQNITNLVNGQTLTNGQQLTTVPSAGYTNVVNGIVGWWKFDEGTGLVALDSSGNLNVGTINGGSSYVTGKVGPYALSFDGSSGYVGASAESILTDNLTFSGWVKWTGVNTTLPVPFYNGNSAGDGYGIIIQDGGCSVGNYIGILLGGKTCDVLNSTYILPSNQWVLVTIERNAGTWYLYVNGNLVVTGGTTSPSSATTKLTIGTASADYFPGSIDDVRIYNRALSADEILDLYNFTK